MMSGSIGHVYDTGGSRGACDGTGRDAAAWPAASAAPKKMDKRNTAIKSNPRRFRGMTMMISREIRLASRPSGWPTPENFTLAEADVPPPGDGQALVRNLFLSVDPYMRGRM